MCRVDDAGLVGTGDDGRAGFWWSNVYGGYVDKGIDKNVQYLIIIN